MNQEHYSVVVVGSGTVGLSVATALAQYGVSVLLAERHAGTTPHPRATGIQPSVKEFFRGLGLDEQIRAAGADLRASKGKVDLASVAGTDLTTAPRYATPPAEVARLTTLLSPTDIGPVSQDRIDGVLRDAARERGAELRYRTTVTAVVQDDDGVTATLVDDADGREYTVRADYLVAADGSGSQIRTELGIDMRGPTDLGNPMINVLFTADLSELVKGDEFAIAEISNPDTEGMMLAVNNRDRWIYHFGYRDDEQFTDFTDERIVRAINAAIGRDDIPVEIVSAVPWRISARVADRVVEGRIVLAGDSAHTIPPIGAFGVSSGVGDAGNLAWKLAYLVKRQAGPALLRSYETERLPIVRFTRDQALLRLTHLDLHWDRVQHGEHTGVTLADPLVTALAHQYHDGALIDPPGSLRSYSRPDLNLDGSPGTRVPHAWVQHQGKRISVLDLPQGGFALLTGPDGGEWVAAAADVAAGIGIDVRGYRVGPGCEVDDTGTAWAAQAGLRAGGALLVRPDLFVAWRSPDAVEAPREALAAVLDRVLDLSSRSAS
ncbi:FAD-dependent monooxygenase [Kitasatospora sp. NPDC089509]|uniref:FAD-dependent monooxygenase n=1 Tax=Kitasatospora sp. NPDC089509 TaxID=3364079 RepID=UPI00383031FE